MSKLIDRLRNITTGYKLAIALSLNALITRQDKKQIPQDKSPSPNIRSSLVAMPATWDNQEDVDLRGYQIPAREIYPENPNLVDPQNELYKEATSHPTSEAKPILTTLESGLFEIPTPLYNLKAPTRETSISDQSKSSVIAHEFNHEITLPFQESPHSHEKLISLPFDIFPLTGAWESQVNKKLKDELLEIQEDRYMASYDALWNHKENGGVMPSPQKIPLRYVTQTSGYSTKEVISYNGHAFNTLLSTLIPASQGRGNGVTFPTPLEINMYTEFREESK